MRDVECCIKRTVPNRSVHGSLEPVLLLFQKNWIWFWIHSGSQSGKENGSEKCSNERDLRANRSKNGSHRSLCISFILVWLFYSVRSHSSSSTQFKCIRAFHSYWLFSFSNNCRSFQKNCAEELVLQNRSWTNRLHWLCNIELTAPSLPEKSSH